VSEAAGGADTGAALPPAVLVTSLAEARFALAAAAPGRVLLLSAEGAAGTIGPLAWLALMRAAGAAASPHALCCGAAPGDALAALRAGCPMLVLAGTHPAFPAVLGAAAEAGARLLPARPPALDLRGLDMRRPGARAKLAHWLGTAPDDSAERLR
jgi:hypothetical protein